MAQDPIRKAVVTTGRTPYKTIAQTAGGAGHTIVCDEPESLGGADHGPTPLETFLAALGGCKTMTARLYADRKEWPLEEAVCTVEQQVRLVEGGGPTKVPHLDIKMEFVGDLTDEQRGRLLDIAERCPVQRMVTGECVVTTSLAQEA